MDRHLFHMRLSCSYREEDNQIDTLAVEHLQDNEWKPFDLNAVVPGFLIFTYSVFTCQHMFMRANAAERNMVLDSASGTIMIDAEPEWHVERLHVSFDARLKAGIATQEDIDYITDRMQQCPLSKNLAPIADAITELKLS